jgi:PmbA protein
MLNIIKEVLTNNKINEYKIIETKIEASELFFIKKNLDMDRAKSVHHFKITVYTNIEENGKVYKGSSTTNIHPTMSYCEVDNTIKDALFAAQYAKNPYYPLVEASDNYKKLEASSFSEESLAFWMNEIAKAIYKYDNYEKGGINSCEIFLNKVYTHILNSKGVDVDYTNYDCMIEFITTWKEEGEEVELYRCLHFSALDAEALSKEVNTMITICKEKAIAKNTPLLKKYSVLLTRDAVKDLFSFYSFKSSSEAVYGKASTWKIGDKIQGDMVKGDIITLSINPFMSNSTYSASFDNDGLPLHPVTIIENGILKNYISDSKYAHYLNIEPTGSIKNIEVCGGNKTEEELKKDPYLEVVAFSNFKSNTLTGDFYGEIRLAWYFDGNNLIPVTGGSISGNIIELQNELFLSKELQKDNNFQGPKMVKLLNVNIAGVE